MKLETKLQVGGRFKFTVRQQTTHEITRSSGWFDNIVLDQGLDIMATKSWFQSCKVGRGNSEPQATQTQLDQFFAVSSTLYSSEYGAAQEAPYFLFSRKTYRFAAGVFDNTILSEVAIGHDTVNQGNGIWNRALIRDDAGQPTTITVLQDEYLDVTCEVRVYPNTADVAGSFNLYDRDNQLISTHMTLTRPMQVTNSVAELGNGVAVKSTATAATIWTGEIAEITSAPQGQILNSLGTGVSSYNFLDYVPGSHKATFQWEIPLNYGNARDIQSISLRSNLGSYQTEVNPPLRKSDRQVLILNLTVTWSRYAGND